MTHSVPLNAVSTARWGEARTCCSDLLIISDGIELFEYHLGMRTFKIYIRNEEEELLKPILCISLYLKPPTNTP